MTKRPENYIQNKSVSYRLTFEEIVSKRYPVKEKKEQRGERKMGKKNKSSIYYVLMALMFGAYLSIMLLPVKVFANELSTDVKSLMEKHGPGVDIAVVGKALPKGALLEWKRAADTLRKARLSLRRLLQKAEKAGEVPDYAVALAGRLDALSDDFDDAVKEFLDENKRQDEDIAKLTQEMDYLRKSALKLGLLLEKALSLIENKKDRDEGWAMGIAAYGSTEFATSKKDLMPIGGVGITTSWRKESLSFDMMLGAGVSVIDKAALSWTFASSLQFILSPKFSVGPAMVMSQDLGDMEGADRWVWEAGCKVKTSLYGLNLWAIPSFGIHGERGYGAGAPTYSPNVGMTVGVDYLLLK